MRFLIGFICYLSFSAVAALDSNKLKFTYQSFEGDKYLQCKHFQSDSFGFDWDVTCKDELSFVKIFRVHLSLKHYQRPIEPKSTYEVLYWVTDRTTNQIYGSGTSFWFNFKESADFTGLTISQSVDHDTAGLYLDIKP